MNLKTLNRCTVALVGLVGLFGSVQGFAQEHWYGEVRQIMVPPLHSDGPVSPQMAGHIEGVLANALRQTLPGTTVSSRNEMQNMWNELAARSANCEAPSCLIDMARRQGADVIVTAHLNYNDPRGILSLRWMNVDNGSVLRTREEALGHDEGRHEDAIRRAVMALCADGQAPMVNSYMPTPPPAPPPMYQPQPQQYQPQPMYQPQPQSYQPPCGDGASCQQIGDYMDAQNFYTNECNNGMGMSCNNLGVMYEHGLGIPMDQFQARNFYNRGCEFNVGVACANLGMMFEKGMGGPQDYGRARMLYDRSCGMGSSMGCYTFGVMWERGLGGPADPMRAREFYQRSCDGGEGRGCYSMANVHQGGMGGPMNQQEATRMWNLGCERGDAESCRRLGRPMPQQARPMEVGVFHPMVFPPPVAQPARPPMPQMQPVQNRPAQPMMQPARPEPVMQPNRLPAQPARPMPPRPMLPREHR